MSIEHALRACRILMYYIYAVICHWITVIAVVAVAKCI